MFKIKIKKGWWGWGAIHSDWLMMNVTVKVIENEVQSCQTGAQQPSDGWINTRKQNSIVAKQQRTASCQHCTVNLHVYHPVSPPAMIYAGHKPNFSSFQSLFPLHKRLKINHHRNMMESIIWNQSQYAMLHYMVLLYWALLHRRPSVNPLRVICTHLKKRVLVQDVTELG